jgi:hypothetical protein
MIQTRRILFSHRIFSAGVSPGFSAGVSTDFTTGFLMGFLTVFRSVSEWFSWRFVPLFPDP